MKVAWFTMSALLLSVTAACSQAQTSNGTIPPSHTGVSGIVESGTHPIAGAAVTLYQSSLVGSGKGARVVGSARTNASGKFFISYAASAETSNVYVVATGGNAGHGANGAIGLSALVGTLGSIVRDVTVNERSTVAFEFALAQFTDASGTIVGTNPGNVAGLHYAALLDRDRLVDPATGKPAAFFPNDSSCNVSALDNCEGLQRMNALANALYACTSSFGASSRPCRALMLATEARSTTLAAVHAVVLDPSRHASAIFALSRSASAYSPALAAAPSAWTIGLFYNGNGKEFDGPGNIAFDATGNIWITNNYDYNTNPTIPACGSPYVIELTALGDDAAGAPFSGGGLAGAGWGITIDRKGDTWVSNFGFAGKDCTIPKKEKSISEFAPNGTPLSGADGWMQGPLDKPQGIATTKRGDVWIANLENDTVTVYRDADPYRFVTFPHVGLIRPWGIAIDAADRVWITGTLSNNVALLLPNGKPVHGSPFAQGLLRHPIGDAVDMENDVWIASKDNGTVTVLNASGAPILGSPIAGGGLKLPWGVAIDGDDNAWIADFDGSAPRVSEICGTQGRCPHGIHPGEPISPTTGYASALLQRLTGIGIDRSGNVWVCDNWRRVAIQTNPGGQGMVEFVGLAAPVKAPAFGPVQRP